ncbi:hypothetical protein LXL04_010924 [Taraxacum kok-saghyz]
MPFNNHIVLLSPPPTVLPDRRIALPKSNLAKQFIRINILFPLRRWTQEYKEFFGGSFLPSIAQSSLFIRSPKKFRINSVVLGSIVHLNRFFGRVLWEITQSIHGRASSVIWKLLPTPMTLWILETEDVSSEIRKQRVERNDEDREDSVQWLLPHQFMRGNAIKMPKRWLTTCLPRIRSNMGT